MTIPGFDEAVIEGAADFLGGVDRRGPTIASDVLTP